MQQQSYRIELPLLAEADTEARLLGHHWIGPEHLLLSVAAKPGGVSRAFFERHQLSLQSLRESVAAVVGPSIRAVRDEQPLTISRRAHLALAHALGGARGKGDPAFTHDGLLVALLADDVAGDAVVGAVLEERTGVSAKEARAELAALTADRDA